MSFLFPANPADGDVVVQPQPDGSMIKGTYNSANNTWAVGELPQEPGIPGPAGPQGAQGDQGVPGRGLSVSGIVDTFEDLPSAPDHALQFWIVDDTNTVYFSDGVAWFDQGGPIRGPQGEPGTPGAPGAAGTAATIAVGNTITGNPGTNAAVVNTGTNSAAVFQFTIPRGEKGEPGQNGTGSGTLTEIVVSKPLTVADAQGPVVTLGFDMSILDDLP
mgnify:CR=1 FL=1